MNDRKLLTLLVTLLATLFLATSANAGNWILRDAGDIQVLGIENALSTAPYEVSPHWVKFETAVDRPMLATADSINSLGGDIQELGIDKALSDEPYEFSPAGMGKVMAAETNEFCTDRVTASYNSIDTVGAEIQLFGMEAALNSRC